MAWWKAIKDIGKREKDDLDRFKQEINRLAAGLERIAADAEQLGQRRRRADNHPWKEFLALYIMDPPGTAPPPDFFRALPEGIRHHAALLKKLKAAIARDCSPESHDVERVRVLLSLESYCRQVTQGRVTIRQIADLLGEDETAFNMRWRRIDHNYTPDSLREVKQNVKEYIAACPSGDLTFAEWLERRAIATAKERTPSEITQILAADSPWYRGA